MSSGSCFWFGEDGPASEACSGFDFCVFVWCEVGPFLLLVFFDELFASEASAGFAFFLVESVVADCACGAAVALDGDLVVFAVVAGFGDGPASVSGFHVSSVAPSEC